MNGAPRMAPIPTSSADRRRDRIAMSGIIVSGRAVPTAARTDPTAPSARPSLWPEPLDPVGEQLGAEEDDQERRQEQDEVASSATPRLRPRTTPTAMTTRIATEIDAIRRSPPGDVPDERRDDPRERRRDESRPARATGSRPAGAPRSGPGSAARIERAARCRAARHAGGQHEHDPDREEADAQVRSPPSAAGRSSGRGRPAAGGRPGHRRARRPSARP